MRSCSSADARQTLQIKRSRGCGQPPFRQVHTLEGLFCFSRLDLCFEPPDFVFLRKKSTEGGKRVSYRRKNGEDGDGGNRRADERGAESKSGSNEERPTLVELKRRGQQRSGGSGRTFNSQRSERR